MQAIRDDLIWLGLTWDKEVRQQDRTARYEEAADRAKGFGRALSVLRDGGRARSSPQAPARDAPAADLRPRGAQIVGGGHRREAQPRAKSRIGGFACRIRREGRGLAPQPTLVSWNDLIRGDQTVDLGSLSDPVLIREDGTFLYTFTSVVDDIDFAHHAHRARRGSRHQHGRAARDLRGCRRRRRRRSGITRCSSAPTARRCRSAWVRCRSRASATRASSRWLCSAMRRSSAPRMRSSH